MNIQLPKNKDYLNKIIKMSNRMIKAEEFAERLPLFRYEILSAQINADDDWITFGERYKDTPLAWGIRRGFYKGKTNRTVSNYEYETGDDNYSEYLFSIYINTVNLFGDHFKNNLEFCTDLSKVFFFDKVNSTFYVKDENIEQVLDDINEWYLKSKIDYKNHITQKEIKKLEKQLENLKVSK